MGFPMPETPMRLTKIVCTIGPATAGEEGIRRLVAGGMNVARLNMSHESVETHRENVRLIKRLNETEGFGVAILLDTRGAEIRTGDVQEKIAVTAGDEVVFSYAERTGETRTVVRVNHEHFAKDAVGTPVLLVDNGDLRFTILEITDDGGVVTRAEDTGRIGSRRHVNIPGADLSMPALQQVDWDALAMGCEEGVDFVALSFIRTAAEVEDVRRFVKEHTGDIGLITKVETRQAVENIDGIIEVSDGIMVARGDLGSELPFTHVPAIQDDLVKRCRDAGVPVIVATHMLESMCDHPTPTRAELTDVAHAAITRTDATMLSGETSTGKYPVRALETMSDILAETEARLTQAHSNLVARTTAPGVREANAAAAVTVAETLHAKAIVVIDREGRTAKALSLARPRCPIFACTDDAWVQRRLQLTYAVIPAIVPLADHNDRDVDAALRAVVARGIAAKGDTVVLVSDVPVHGTPVGTVQVRILT